MKNSLLLATITTLFLIASPVFADGAKDFGSCEDPQGILKVKYNDGIHGVPGRSETYRGTDAVYRIDGNDILLQCLCTTDKEGIQTNWMKAKTLSEKEIKDYTYKGWVYIPDGGAWGLDYDPYLAQNTEYTCGPRPTPQVEVKALPASGVGSNFNIMPIGAGLIALGITLLAFALRKSNS